ncbi:uncharacterized protein KQ657_001428 [Scheffersomyces spartinae]|uniref:glutaminase n=1 Tax=Scheffersomyces spartinae TaxID=45513 RepID=A0A9P7V7R1_9ASCO|nr:uncharacterized protein KQ657_001428 [Scheffersomyces spartinae]KAG7192648.1 hypothetical protein KQ657_001428 [Scheffersomyces spartinae]
MISRANNITIGVLALQGAFAEHIDHLTTAADSLQTQPINVIPVRTPPELDSCDALVIPGGESTAISLIAERTGLLAHLMDYVASEKPVWGTCAGLIFLAKQVVNGKPNQQILGGMDIQVHRNAFGRQLHSFEAPLDFSSFIKDVIDFPTVFIRAPVISKILENAESESESESELTTIISNNTYKNKAPLQILHQLENGFIVAVKQGSKLGTSFHPELVSDTRFHKWFILEFVLRE